MWETPSYSLIIPLTCLIMAGKIHAQCEKPLVGEESALMWNFPEESTVAFTCSTGYRPVDSGASNSITCKEKQWTTLDLQCKKKSCGNPGEVSNGKYSIPDGIEFGATITVQCNEGYAVFGPKTRTCQENGWDGKPAVYELLKCLPPPAIQNGVFEPEDESYGYNDAVSYSCSRGYTLIGESTIVCSANGTFQHPPQCL
ncbi:complement component receptor 1-like protein, partial [Clarias magur]